jgi:hypothetical protein
MSALVRTLVASSTRRAVIAALIWLAIAALLVRIASGGTLADWPHVYHEEPRLFVAVMLATAVDLILAAVLLIGRGTYRFQASVAWAVLIAAFAVVLVLVGHTSGLAIGLLALISAWLCLGAIRGSPHG